MSCSVFLEAVSSCWCWSLAGSEGLQSCWGVEASASVFGQLSGQWNDFMYRGIAWVLCWEWETALQFPKREWRFYVKICWHFRVDAWLTRGSAGFPSGWSGMAAVFGTDCREAVTWSSGLAAMVLGEDSAVRTVQKKELSSFTAFIAKLSTDPPEYDPCLQNPRTPWKGRASMSCMASTQCTSWALLTFVSWCTVHIFKRNFETHWKGLQGIWNLWQKSERWFRHGLWVSPWGRWFRKLNFYEFCNDHITQDIECKLSAEKIKWDLRFLFFKVRIIKSLSELSCHL